MSKKLTLFFLILIFLCIIFFTENGYKFNKNLKLPINAAQSTQLAYYYESINDDIGDLNLSKKHREKTRLFNQQEVKIPVKGYSFGSQYVGGNNRYHELGQFEYDKSIYKLIIYTKTGEADTPLLNVQLNSYDTKGNLIDALLLGGFFRYEEMSCFSDFVINSDYSINIDNYVIYRYEEDDDGISNRLIKNPAAQVYLKEKYQIEKGQFRLISREKP